MREMLVDSLLAGVILFVGIAAGWIGAMVAMDEAQPHIHQIKVEDFEGCGIRGDGWEEQFTGYELVSDDQDRLVQLHMSFECVRAPAGNETVTEGNAL